MCVLPEPAPASTRRLRSRSEMMVARDWSSLSGLSGGLFMGLKPPPGREQPVLRFCFDAAERVSGPACDPQVAEHARLFVSSVNEGARSYYIAQIREHTCENRLARRVDDTALLATLDARK